MVTEPPAVAVDDAPFPAAEAMFVFRSHRWTWFDEVIEFPLQMVSTTMFPAVVPVTVTLGEVMAPNPVTGVPSGVAWSTPVNDTDPAEWSFADPVVVANTVFAPVAGAISRRSRRQERPVEPTGLAVPAGRYALLMVSDEDGEDTLEVHAPDGTVQRLAGLDLGRVTALAPSRKSSTTRWTASHGNGPAAACSSTAAASSAM